MGLVHKISERSSGALVATGVTCAPGVDRNENVQGNLRVKYVLCPRGQENIHKTGCKIFHATIQDVSSLASFHAMVRKR